MESQRTVERLSAPDIYPLIRNFLGYGLGLTSPYECREVLSPTARLAKIDGVWEEGVQAMITFIEQTFSNSHCPLWRLNGQSFQTYLEVFVQWLREQNISVQF